MGKKFLEKLDAEVVETSADIRETSLLVWDLEEQLKKAEKRLGKAHGHLLALRSKISAAIDEVDRLPTSFEALLASDVDYLQISGRAVGCLRGGGIITIGELIKLTEEGVRKLEHVGARTLVEITEALALWDLKLKKAKKK